MTKVAINGQGRIGMPPTHLHFVGAIDDKNVFLTKDAGALADYAPPMASDAGRGRRLADICHGAQYQRDRTKKAVETN